MNVSEKRSFKDQLYEQFARIGKALGSPHRLELLDVLAQGERTVEALAQETGMPMANASQHLQVLRAARLVETRRAPEDVLHRRALLWRDDFQLSAQSLPFRNFLFIRCRPPCGPIQDRHGRKGEASDSPFFSQSDS